MKLYVDLETLQLIEGPGFRNPVTSLRFKRGDAALLEVTFLTDGTTTASIGDPATLEIRFGIKPRNRYDVGYLVQNSAWTMPAVDAETPVYQCFPSFNTEELDSALGVGSSTGTELPEITLMGEITWREGTGEPTSTRTFLVIVENDVNRGTEGTPVKLPTPDDWLAAKQTPTPVATNTAKKALTGVPAGAKYVITGEAGRIEQYVGDLNGSAEANDDNWIIIGPNTVDLWLQNNEYTTAVFSHPDGNVSIGYGAGMIRVGWIREHKAYSVTGMPQTAYAYQINGFNADIANWPVLMVRPSQMTKFYLAPIFPPRAQVKLLLD